MYAAPRRRGRRSPRTAGGRARRMATAAPTAAGRDAVPAAAQSAGTAAHGRGSEHWLAWRRPHGGSARAKRRGIHVRTRPTTSRGRSARTRRGIHPHEGGARTEKRVVWGARDAGVRRRRGCASPLTVGCAGRMDARGRARGARGEAQLAIQSGQHRLRGGAHLSSRGGSCSSVASHQASSPENRRAPDSPLRTRSPRSRGTFLRSRRAHTCGAQLRRCVVPYSSPSCAGRSPRGR